MQRNGISAFRAIVRLAGFFRHQLAIALAGVALLFASSAATVVAPRIFGQFIDELQARNTAEIPLLILLFGVFEAVRVLGSGASGVLLSITGQRTLHLIRVAVMDHLLRLPVRTINEKTPGGLVSHVASDVGALTDLFSTGFVESIEKFLIVGGITVSILTLNLKLGALLLSAFIVLFIIAAILTTMLHRFYKNLRVAAASMQEMLGETLLGTPTARLFSMYGEQEAILRRTSEEYAAAQLRPMRGFAVFHPIVTLVNGTSMALLIWVGGGMVREGTVTFGTLIAMSTYILWLFWPIMHIVDRWNVLLSGSAAAQRIFDLLDTHSERSNGKELELPRPLEGSVEFRGVEFSYLPGAPLFSGLSFGVSKGERVAIVGATGSGKTTIANLLLRLWEISGGSILVDGSPIAASSIHDLRSRFGLIEQELYLFSGTIGENISLWDTQNPDRLAALREKLPQLPDFNRSAEERGANLSMGERQLVSLARALYSRPEILILDEATAHLDPILDRQLQAAMTELAKGATTFIIAHRLSSIVDADRILVLHHGALIESGSHEELVLSGGVYSKLYAIEQQEQRGGRF